MSNGGFDRTEFIGYFRDETMELLERIDADLLLLEGMLTDGALDPDAVNSIFRSLHTIKGNAGMLEFRTVTTLANWLESAVDLVRSASIVPDEEFLEVLFSGRDVLSLLVTRAITGDFENSPDIEAYLHRIEDFVTAKRAPVAAASAEAINGDDPSDEEITRFEAEIAQLLAQQTGTDEKLPAAPPGAGTPVAKAVAGRSEAAGSTIRVALERLDLLLDLVGELVINRTRVADISQSLLRAVDPEAQSALRYAKELIAASSTHGRITNELQETVMKARMVPVGQVFERFPRTVRDLAKATGKQIHLAISGIETDLDKTIVDQIGEPLMHLVRNCVDHGIEVPQVRVAAGKPAQGTIRLNAYHEGNQVIIEIGDDGNGIPLEKVRKRGIERGLIESHVVYSDEEIIDLIFAPGFSTAEQVTNISGRGVGMDVVKKSVLELKGQLDVVSTPGRGSTFFIRLPLTLAIIRTLLIGIGGRLFAIPLDAVLESQRIPERTIRSIGGASVVTLRGQVLPLISLPEALKLAARPLEEGYAQVVVVEHKGRRVGLVVDSFEGDQEIVIKPLAAVMGPTEYISGATILGNGTIALILDVASIVGGHSRLDYTHNDHGRPALPAAGISREAQLVG